MPRGSPYNSFVRPYAIRVDEFSDSPSLKTVPLLHLLSHTHTDHIQGLSAKSFGHAIYCSQDAKEMLLRHEVLAERQLKEKQVRAENVRTFKHLKVDPVKFGDGTVFYNGARDLLRPLPLNTPTRCELSHGNYVTITLIDANHCPGAVMFLIEGALGSILHTGDFRAEPWYLDSLKKNPFLERYLAPYDSHASGSSTMAISESLEAIYLDTACMLSTKYIPSKDEATSGLVSLMKHFPSTTRFFINAWTWGYEDVHKAIARAFRSPIHVDRYKHSVYSHLEREPFLRSVITRDPRSSRFHACERFDRCEEVRVDGRDSHTPDGNHVVYVNPVTMGSAEWQAYVRHTEERLKRGETVHHLLVAVSRHSSLPELQSFVSLFKPKRVVPNTLDPSLCGLDWAAIPGMFSGLLSSDELSFREEVRQSIADELGRQWATISPDLDDGEDVALANLEGDGALEVAERWAVGGKIRNRLQTLLQYLDGPERQAVERLLAAPAYEETQGETQDVWNEASAEPPAPSTKTEAQENGFQGRATYSQTERAMAPLRAGFSKPAVRSHDSDEDTEDGDEDARMRTAHYLFASYADIPSQYDEPVFSSSSPIREVTNSERVTTTDSASRALGLSRTVDVFPAPASLSPATTRTRRLSHSSNPDHDYVGTASKNALNEPKTPQRPRHATLSSPFQLLSPAPSTRKRRRAEQEPSTAPISKIIEDASNPFAATRNEDPATRLGDSLKRSSRRSRSPESHLQDSVDRAPKRRKTLKDEDRLNMSASVKSVLQARATIIPQHSPQALDRTDTEDVLTSLIAGSSRTLVGARRGHDRQSRASLRKSMAERLSALAPPRVAEHRSSATTEDAQPRSPRAKDEIVPETQEGSDDDAHFPDELPLRESQASSDIEIDMERAQELECMWRDELAKGTKPVAVIPRLGCLESQQDS
ncbi:hypothetical protein PsYK624_077870 [Phanerochaete sordida]|uniref:Protein artemis n=1 Tax=Phanerochaete sordida TaxID=48140 RepID=A0A9P3GBL3_9APHY|nr:hypothetical protein PsYK624_077870 [Phanerochaete sordida]